MTTYRIQFHAGFTVADLIDILDYLQDLGIDTVYGSPVLTATTGSTHGYDVTDPEHLNPEITTEAEWERLHAELSRRGMSYMQDIVPNHTALTHENVWFKTVIGAGREGRYAGHFDIDWDHPRMPGRMMLPVLGEEPEAAAEAGQITHYRGGVKVYEDHWEGPEADREQPANGELPVQPVHWQRVNDFINYRRFFTVNQLIGMRTEEEAVYEDLHRRTFADVRAGRIHHLRVDHVDGLLDPTTYLQRLRKSVGPEIGIYVEKILEPGEQLPEDWPVQGTTGYDFLAAVNRLLTDDETGSSFSDLYEELTGEPLPSYPELVFRNKLMLVREHFSGELDNLVRRWSPLLTDELRQDFRETLAHWLAAFPVYRIYPHGGRLTDHELAVCMEATTAVTLYAPERGRAVLTWVNWLAHQEFSGQSLEYLQRTQQLSGPLMAKGVEDTTFYQFWRQAHLNEVGSSADPNDRLPVREFHAFIRERAASSMNATATHDTKRGEDGRAFLQALTFYPGEWRSFVTLAREKLDMGPVRPRGFYLVLQSLVAGYPLHHSPEEADLRERLHRYLEKAIREGKEMSDWAEPNEEYETGLKDLADQLLDDSDLRTHLENLLKTIWPQTRHNSFAQVILKCTAPGHPDVYQGTEGWDLSFVDPDNRRPVDYAERVSWLEGTPGDKYAPAQKAQLLRALLHLRRDHPGFFRDATYEPLSEGDSVLAFRRVHRGQQLVVKIAKRAGTRVERPGEAGLHRVVNDEFGEGLGVWFGEP
ncbi:malto-oligosyltrehalose synthase [Lewinella marina]|uniref:Malto-oligosyltrehalose synthase n=1 Tax=Neolewinella marina TaxID=438751 RepID=A0A2G0CCF5_9BACT|nr:malto-oligosyltrehalose synthase [Neolewinella marina]NJB87660.1 malto-oligosyltrehalose synthase [Neolewinella marina]PHK97656.1 malto-oligosyltrehalose synthase [Neolewinella marina]